jgi:hypothetical protein
MTEAEEKAYVQGYTAGQSPYKIKNPRVLHSGF